MDIIDMKSPKFDCFPNVSGDITSPDKPCLNVLPHFEAILNNVMKNRTMLYASTNN